MIHPLLVLHAGGTNVPSAVPITKPFGNDDIDFIYDIYSSSDLKSGNIVSDEEGWLYQHLL